MCRVDDVIKYLEAPERYEAFIITYLLLFTVGTACAQALIFSRRFSLFTNRLYNKLWQSKGRSEKDKKNSKKNVCSSTGDATQVGQIRRMIRKVGGGGREWGYPVLVDERDPAVTDKEKAEMLARVFVKVHLSENLLGEEQRAREQTKEEQKEMMEEGVLLIK